MTSLCSFEESAGFFVVRHAAEADDIFSRGAIFAVEAGERATNAIVVGFHVEIFDLGLVGQAERVRRIGPCDEGVRDWLLLPP